jgi:beta propeller repeat protein
MRHLGVLLIAGFSVSANAATGTITRLSNGSAADQQNSPAISGNEVVWTDVVTGPPANFDIYAYDVTTGQSINLTNTPLDQEFLEDIDGANVVWTHTSAGIPGDIVLYDLTMNRASTIASSTTTAHYQSPSIRGNYVVFLKVTATQNDVLLYDMTNGPVVVTNDAAMQGHPRVGGDTVVFEDYSAGNSDILGWPISTAGPSFAIATGAGDQITPDIDGNTVIWVSNNQIFGYDLTTKATTQLTTATSTKVLPRISGSRIVWSDDRNGNLDLYTYDLSTNTESPLVTGAGDQYLSDIDGDHVVYTDNASSFEQVFMYTFPDPPPPPSNLPEGCDPAKTNLVGSPVVMTKSGHRPVYASGPFSPDPNKTYHVCVENGQPDGSQRTTQFSFQLGEREILNPSDFKPTDNPPHYVAAPISLKHHGHHDDSDCDGWEAALFGRYTPSRVTVSIRVSK